MMSDSRILAAKLKSLVAAYELKQIERSGWLQSGVRPQRTESVAAHSWGMAFLFTVFEDTFPDDIDKHRALRMAIVHDLAEARVGDLTPQDQISLETKHGLEQHALEELVMLHPNGFELMDLWDDFEAGQSAEARLVRHLDKLDMLLQAYVYEKQDGVNLDSFWEGMAFLFKGSVFETIYDYIYANRDKN